MTDWRKYAEALVLDRAFYLVGEWAADTLDSPCPLCSSETCRSGGLTSTATAYASSVRVAGVLSGGRP